MLRTYSLSTLILLSFTCLASETYAVKNASVLNATSPYSDDIQSKALTVTKSLEGKLESYDRTHTQIQEYYGKIVRYQRAQKKDATAIMNKLDPILTFLEEKIDRTRGKLGIAEALSRASQTVERFVKREPYGFHAQLLLNGRQEEADCYALMRFLTYKNMYDAIPNPENSAQTLHMIIGAMPDVYRRMLATATNNFKENTAEEAARCINKNVFCIRAGTIGVNDRPQKPMTNLAMSDSEVSDLVGGAITQSSKRSFDNLELDSLRPHVFLKNQADKWLKKIDFTTSPLTKNFGLDAAFANPDLTDEGKKNLSFVFKSQEGAGLEDSFLQKNPQAKTHQLKAMREQLFLSFGERMAEENNGVLRRRIKAIIDFLRLKEQNLQAKGASSTETTSDQEEVDPQEKAKHAFLKYMSYIQLHYALTHDEKGQKLGSTDTAPSIEDTLGNSIYVGSRPQDMFPQTTTTTTTTTTTATAAPLDLTVSTIQVMDRVDSILQAKAQKWAGKVLSLETESAFLENNALRASLFPLDK